MVHRSALLTDLYQLTMLNGYFDAGMRATAVFEFFVRRLPPTRRFLVWAGLEQALEYLEDLRFTAEELNYLAGDKRFGRPFLDHLASFRFTGDVYALPEGSLLFAEEPALRVVAPIAEAQFIESRLLNILHLQTLIASKAARVVLAAQGRAVVDFGMRRSHGAEAALFAARASYLAGYAGTATVEAGMRYAIPTFGTMAHSFIQAHEDEASAFRHFAHTQPGNVTLLIDTYDVEAAVRKVVALADELEASGATINAVRVDSGDLGANARRVRQILDDAGRKGIGILLSGDLDEHRIGELVASGTPTTGFGVGTRLNASVDEPTLDCVYKLQEYDGRPTRKRSVGKETWPGIKQVCRHYGEDGRMSYDTVCLAEESLADAPLLEPVMRDGKRTGPPSDMGALRARVAEGLAALPDRERALEGPSTYEVRLTDSLKSLARQIDERGR